jgi:cold shock CspA family protein
MSEVKKGVLVWWSKNRNCGVIVVPDTNERYFVHTSAIIRGPVTPTVDSVVSFHVSDVPPREGRLPSAIGVEIESPANAGISASQPEVK